MRRILLLSFSVLLGAASLTPAMARIRVVGSDLLGSTLAPLLRTEAAQRGWELDLSFEGSLTGEAEIRSGEASIAILAIPFNQELNGDLETLPFGFEVAVVAVHELNPIQELSVAQLRELFASRSGGESVNWGEMGADGTWAARQVSVHAIRQRDRLTMELFRERVLGTREMQSGVAYWDTKEELLAKIAEDSSAVGILPLREDHPQVRALFIAGENQGQAYNPTPQAIFYGDYPLRLSYRIAVSAAASEEVEAVVRFLLGDQVAIGLQAGGYQPVPETERRQYQMDLDFGG